MIGLLDVNVLVALAWPNHVHHRPAREWFDTNRPNGWATCSTTQSSFVRVSSNHRILPEAKSPLAAWTILKEMVAEPSHEFWIDDLSIVSTEYFDPRRLQGPRQVTDAHLLALAQRHKGRLVTFDRGIRDLLSTDRNECLLLLGS